MDYGRTTTTARVRKPPASSLNWELLMIRDIAADVAAYGAGLTVEDVTSYRRAGLVNGIGERQTNAFHTRLLRCCIGLGPFALWRTASLGRQAYDPTCRN